MPKLIPLNGKQFGRLTVNYRSSDDARGKPKWCCTCTCGASVVVSGCNLKTGNSKSCGCLQKERATYAQLLRPYESLYRAFARSAAHDVHISYEQFLEFAKIAECHYCGARVTWATNRITQNGSAYNLDRMDNELGYTVDNCVVCCGRCNVGKGKNFTYEEWKQLGNVIRSWKK